MIENHARTRSLARTHARTPASTVAFVVCPLETNERTRGRAPLLLLLLGLGSGRRLDRVVGNCDGRRTSYGGGGDRFCSSYATTTTTNDVLQEARTAHRGARAADQEGEDRRGRTTVVNGKESDGYGRD